MDELRLGDVIDDHCIKCRRLTNHSIVSMLGPEVAKVRCRSCYHEHTYLHEQAPPSKKDLKKAELFAAVLAQGGVPADSVPGSDGAGSDGSGEEPPVVEASPAAKGKAVRTRVKKA
jgi:hypothetical protein